MVQKTQLPCRAREVPGVWVENKTPRNCRSLEALHYLRPSCCPVRWIARGMGGKDDVSVEDGPVRTRSEIERHLPLQ